MDTLGSRDNPFSGKQSNITPFSSWKIWLPPTLKNEDIKFDNCPRGLTIRITFQILAQLKAVTTTTANREQKALNLRCGAQIPQLLPLGGINAITSGSNVNRVENCSITHNAEDNVDSDSITAIALQPAPVKWLASLFYRSPNVDATIPPSSCTPIPDISSVSNETTTSVTNADVLNNMIGKSVCSEWDAVFSMTAKQINDNLYDQYTDQVNNPTFLRSTGNVVKKTKTSENVTTITTFNFVFKAPRLQFLLNNSDSAWLMFPLKSGHYECAIEMNGVVIPIEKVDVTEEQEYYIQGDIPLAVLPGEVSSQRNIALKLNEGAFSYQYLKSTANPSLNEGLTSYFTGLKDGYEVYNLGMLDTKEITLLPSLTPKSFKFHVHHSPSNRDILQLFITTTGEMQTEPFLNLDEPFPTTYESSLIISSKVFFSSILPTCLGDSGLRLDYESKETPNNGNNDKVWTTRVKAGTASSSFPEKMIESYQQKMNDNTCIMCKDYVAVDNDTIHIDLSGMTFKSGACDNSPNVEMTFDRKGEEYKFKYGTCKQIHIGAWSNIDYSYYPLKVNVTMKATLGFDVTGTGQHQILSLSELPSTNPFIDGDLEPAGTCKCNDHELQKSFLENLRTGMEPQLKSIFDKKFTSVSLFALKNILFPAKNIIEFKEAFVPGDMIIFGNFTKET